MSLHSSLSLQRLSTVQLTKPKDLNRFAAALLSYLTLCTVSQPSRNMTFRRLLDLSISREFETSSFSVCTERATPTSDPHPSVRLEALWIGLCYNLEDVVRYIVSSFGTGTLNKVERFIFCVQRHVGFLSYATRNKRLFCIVFANPMCVFQL